MAYSKERASKIETKDIKYIPVGIQENVKLKSAKVETSPNGNTFLEIVFEKDGVPEQLFEINMDFYNRLKPYCEEYGIKVALEARRFIPVTVASFCHSLNPSILKFIFFLQSVAYKGWKYIPYFEGR